MNSSARLVCANREQGEKKQKPKIVKTARDTIILQLLVDNLLGRLRDGLRRLRGGLDKVLEGVLGVPPGKVHIRKVRRTDLYSTC